MIAVEEILVDFAMDVVVQERLDAAAGAEVASDRHRRVPT